MRSARIQDKVIMMANVEKPKEKTTVQKATKPKDTKAKATAPAKKMPVKSSAITVRGKRKEAVARAYIRKGRGVVRVNKVLLSAVQNPYARSIMSQPLTIADDKIVKNVDIDVNVYGGGPMGQAQAVRCAIARALVEYSKDPSLREEFNKRDKFFLVEDSRRVEPKKYKGPKARARFQKSYR